MAATIMAGAKCRLRIYEIVYKSCLIQHTSHIPPICSSSPLNPIYHMVCFKGVASQSISKDLRKGDQMKKLASLLLQLTPKQELIFIISFPHYPFQIFVTFFFVSTPTDQYVLEKTCRSPSLRHLSPQLSSSCQEANAVIVIHY